MKIFYHNDMDGRAAAYIATYFTKEKYKELYDTTNLEYIELDYKKPININSIQKDELVIIVDYSFSEKTLPILKGIMNKTVELIWIDHHKTSIELYEKYDELGYRFKGMLSDEMSGAALTYKFFNEISGKQTELKDMPEWVQYVSDYDTWAFNKGVATHYFKLAMDSINHQPWSKIWDRLNDIEFGDIIFLENLLGMGETIKCYIDITNEEFFKSFGFETEFECHKCIAVNKSSNSWIFGNKLKEYDFGIVFCYDGKQYNYSLFSENKDIDVSKIAQMYGGGGHKGAAGFYSDKLLIHKIGGEI